MIRNTLIFGMAVLSWFTTSTVTHESNHFHFHPILEIAAILSRNVRHHRTGFGNIERSCCDPQPVTAMGVFPADAHVVHLR
jgi:hypothetical protein